MAVWSLLIVAGIAVTGVLATEFFSHPRGMDRLAVVPVILGAGPLIVGAVVGLLLRPRK